MANGIKIGDPRGFNKWRLKFRKGSRVRQEGRGRYRPKRHGNNNKMSPKTLNDKNDYQKLSNKISFYSLDISARETLVSQTFINKEKEVG